MKMSEEVVTSITLPVDVYIDIVKLKVSGVKYLDDLDLYLPMGLISSAADENPKYEVRVFGQKEGSTKSSLLHIETLHVTRDIKLFQFNIKTFLYYPYSGFVTTGIINRTGQTARVSHLKCTLIEKD